MQKKSQRIINGDLIKQYATYLREQEKSASTVQKYVHDLSVLCEYMEG